MSLDIHVVIFLYYFVLVPRTPAITTVQFSNATRDVTVKLNVLEIEKHLYDNVKINVSFPDDSHQEYSTRYSENSIVTFSLNSIQIGVHQFYALIEAQGFKSKVATAQKTRSEFYC